MQTFVTVSYPDCKDVPLEISFVVDSSGSIKSGNFALGLWFIQNFIDYFNIGQDKVKKENPLKELHSLILFISEVNSESSSSWVRSNYNNTNP